MNCTNCGKEISGSICSNCGTDHTDLFYKLLEDAQVRREYSEALSYMLMIRKSCKDKNEIEEIDRKIAKLQFSMTDLTGNSLNNANRRGNKITKVLKSTLIILVFLSLIMTGSKLFTMISESSIRKNKKTLPIALNIVFKEKNINNEINIEKIEYIMNLLDSRENLKLNMVLNGILLEKINFKNPSLIKKMKKLIQNEKLEILGTTYSESILAANSIDSNRWQIEEQLLLLKKILGVTPKGFWNEGGIWEEKLGKIIKEYGYEYVIIEDRILKNSDSKLSEYVIRSTENGSLIVINNDKDFIFKVERFLLERDKEVLSEIETYIQTVYEANENGDYILNYSSTINLEDVNLLAIEEFIEHLTSLKIARIINYPMILNEVDLVREDISPIQSGTSVFLDLDVELYFNNEFSSWSEFYEKSTDLKERLEYFKSHQNNINNISEENKNLKDLYKHYFLMAQYKLGKPFKENIMYKNELELIENIVKLVSLKENEYEDIKKRNHYLKKNSKIYLLNDNKLIFLYDEKNDKYLDNFNGEKTIVVEELEQIDTITL